MVNHTHVSRLTLGLLVAALALPGAAAQTLYATDGAADNPATRLYTLDKTTGAVLTNVGPIGFAICTLAFDPTTGILYGATGWRATLMPDHLFTIDPATATATLVGPTVSRVAGLTFDSTGQLWAWSEDGDGLASIDKATGAFTFFGSSGVGTAGSGMVFNPGGELWVATRVFDFVMHRISTTTGQPTGSLATSGSLYRTKGLTYDNGGTLYCLQRITGRTMGVQRALATLDLTTGVVTQVGPTLAGMDGLAFQRGTPPPACSITGPLAGSTVGGTISIFVSATDPQSDPVTLTFEHSTDGGATWTLNTPAPGSPLTNPSMPVATPAPAAEFHWCSPVDGVGIGAPLPLTVRVTISDGTQSSTCSVGVTVDNGPAAPTCMLTAPPGTQRGDITIDITTSTTAPTAFVILEWSTNGGVSFTTASMSPTSPNPNPAPTLPTGASSFVWRSTSDGVGATGLVSVILRARVDDGLSIVPGSCSTSVNIDNAPLCTSICGDCNQNLLGPDILDSLTAAQIAAGLVSPTPLQVLCCDVNSSLLVDIIDALVIAQDAAGLPVTPVCP